MFARPTWILLAGLTLSHAGCDSSPASQRRTATAPTPVAQPAAADAVELIPRDALFGNPERADVAISPDGTYLSWIAPVDGVLNVWVAPVDDLGKARPVTTDKTRGITLYYWSYRPGTLLYLRDTGGDEDYHLYAVDLAGGESRDLTPYPKTRAVTVGFSHKHPDALIVGMNDRDPKWHDLYRVDLATGERTLIERNDHEIAGYRVDADYKLRLAIRARSDGGHDILEPDGRGGWKVREQIPFDDALGSGYVDFTTDGKIAYLRDSRDRNTVALYAVDLASGERTLVFEDPRADISDILFHPQTGVVQAVQTNYLREEWKVLDPAVAGDFDKLRTLGTGVVSIHSRTLDDATWIVAHAAPEAPTVFFRYDRRSGDLTRLFSARPALDGKPLVPQWPREIVARDGLKLVSYLTLPHHADPERDGKPNRPVPMVLLVHGGPWSRDDYGYHGTVQWLANRGYAVLQVNYRGSTGFGKDFVNKANFEWAGKMHDDLIDAVQWAVDQGVTTADQVAIMGGSYGGYATLVGLTFTPDTFKCGVDIVGPSNLNTLFASFPAYWASFMNQWYLRVGDSRTEEGRKQLFERSPLSRVDAIKKPLLIAQGVNDPRVTKVESDQIVAAMQAKNIPVTYLLFPDEGHGFARAENNKAFTAVAEGFLGTCLGGRVEPIGDSFAGSSITIPVGADGVPGLAEALA
ncbi:MAG TPA: S9 family peptidase, partial [Nannocystis sp.]